MSKSSEQIIRDAIMLHCPDAEVFNTKESEWFGLALYPKDKDPSIVQALEAYHFASQSEGYNINQCMKEVLEDISNIYRPNIKKLFIRLIQVCSEKEFGTGLVNHKVCARFTLSFEDNGTHQSKGHYTYRVNE